MAIDIYYHKFSPPCRAVLMTAKQLKIDLNMKIVDLAKGEQLTKWYLKKNPIHTIPCIDDNGFILWESIAIMQYLCTKYAPDSGLYPKDPKTRALVDKSLNMDSTLMSHIRVLAKSRLSGIQVSEMTLMAINDYIKAFDTMMANKYLVGNSLTIADLSVLAGITFLQDFGYDLSGVPNINAWSKRMADELPYFVEINKFEQGEFDEFLGQMKKFFETMMKK